MNIHINQRPFTLPEPATVTDALAAFGAKPPFAVAVNGQFVARGEHGSKVLSAGDRLDVVSPVAGG
ncbi:Sulfur carrier protein ThiS [Caballeronia glathei]|jgi:sulfur carrier protein|uniref:Thiamine biosynthesis protein ThiS n=1 Tax=Caballeronia glathei TaxID=60547 RepID=A0A069PGX8_9BURK|nr:MULTISPECIES: sulfur carrier protein ThiS [Burkholderiaceae]KDR39983.1 thiamine biosynthesis protein ThiS [Caballeronia glathei]TCK41847.1 sulfur carrier protein [Paraburkholderia sp. BL8N3]CDY75774.1 Sulfur carrier protein ThiS [Caballeronia glathei]